MSRQVSAGEGVPSVFYRNAIDLNRFSNGIAGKIARENIFVIIKASKQLQKIDESKGPSYKAARLRSLIKQTKNSLSKWQEESVDTLIKDLEGVANLQAGFVEGQIKKALPSAMQEKIHDQIGYSVQSVAVSPGFAKAVVTNEPTDISFAAAARSQQRKAGAGVFNLTAKQGAELMLPNGDTVKKAFRGLASQQANRFNQIVRTGLLSGEPTQDIARQLVGTLDFGEKAKTLKQLGQAGGEATKIATHQISTIVRTSVSQVSNAASQNVYKANQEVTEEYRYVSTLDSRTSAVCRNLDGQVFKYNEGPTPPQHFGCRSTTVAVINYKKWGFSPPPAGKRASADGPVPANTTYGKWLYDKRKAGTKFTPGPEQIKVLGTQKAKYFNRLSNKYGPDEAMKKFMREDNSETSLATLQKRYGRPEDIKPRKKKAAAPKAKATPVKPSPAIKKIDKEIAETKKQLKEAKAQLKALEERNPLQPTIAQLQGMPEKAKVQAVDVNNAFNLMDNMDGLAGKNAQKLRKFAEQREVFAAWTSGAETKGRAYGPGAKKIDEKIAFLKDNPQLKRSLDLAKKRGTKNVFNNAPDVDPITRKNMFNNVEKTTMGLGKIDEILDSGLKGSTEWGHNYFVRFVTTQKTTAFGYTFQGANHIAMKTKPFHKKIKNLTEIRQGINRSVQEAAKGRPLGNVDTDLYQFVGRQIKSKQGSSWLTTYVHEMGHQVHYAAGRPAMAGTPWIPSRYGGSNYLEQFAETFVQYVFDPDALKKASPAAYKWVDETVNAALKAPF